ncbi:MAG: quinone-dependent dihydroorotate dehydrogenase [Saprospiraceae bacterium]|nr:quinone-dependent dihydroorotate dehydrogenase [Saprospiraceae bacterium]
MYKYILKPILFLFQPENAHAMTIHLMKIVLSVPLINYIFRANYRFEHPGLEKEIMGLKFNNPVGLAAGFDKDGKYFREMANLGFGFIEIGTVTPKPQEGNPKPRLFRLPKDHALINRMGFNNDGANALQERLAGSNKTSIIIGGNIGKNKLTPNENAVDDYIYCFQHLFSYVDYFTVNVSSPNTPGLRALQDKEPLTALLNKLMLLNLGMPKPKPILLKIAPDLTNDQLDDVVQIVLKTGINGIIATNTTIERSNLLTDTSIIGTGGLSGKPLKDRATEVIRYIAERAEKKFVIIGAGGIESPEDAIEKLNAGADLIQIYTGLVYSGPGLVKKIKKGIVTQNNL